jgi:Abortive infection alpha
MADHIRDTAEAVKGIVEAVPVYEDLLQPAVREVGKSLETVAKTVHIALLPVAALVWSYEQIGEWLLPVLTRKLGQVPDEQLITPAIEVAGPAIEAMRFTSSSSEELRDMYANLLATAMDKQTAESAHPGFVEIIKQLTPDEARLLRTLAPPGEPLLRLRAMIVGQPNRWWQESDVTLIGLRAGCQYQHLVWSYITNLERLGVVRSEDTFFTEDSLYHPLEESPQVTQFDAAIAAHNFAVDQALAQRGDAPPDDTLFRLLRHVDKRRLIVTPFGRQFLAACVNREERRPAPEEVPATPDA